MAGGRSGKTHVRRVKKRDLDSLALSWYRRVIPVPSTKKMRLVGSRFFWKREGGGKATLAISEAVRLDTEPSMILEPDRGGLKCQDCGKWLEFPVMPRDTTDVGCVCIRTLTSRALTMREERDHGPPANSEEVMAKASAEFDALLAQHGKVALPGDPPKLTRAQREEKARLRREAFEAAEGSKTTVPVVAPNPNRVLGGGEEWLCEKHKLRRSPILLRCPWC